MQLRVHATFGAPDLSGHFLRKYPADR
jgi:hypothetical protein